MDKNILIQAENLSKRYTLNQGKISINEFVQSIFKAKKNQYLNEDELWALKDISFTLKKGQSLGIIGKNGAGKSTLLKMLAGITSPTSGHLKINGSVASLLEIGSGFHPELTGRENVYYNAKILGLKRHEVDEKFDEIIAFSGLGKRFIDTAVKYYSSGMFLRLAFAQATHLDKDILLFDEVLAVGDKDFQIKCTDRILALKNQGKSFVIVSHNLGSLDMWVEQVLLLEQGKTKKKGAFYDVLKSYIVEDKEISNSGSESKNHTELQLEPNISDETEMDENNDSKTEITNSPSVVPKEQIKNPNKWVKIHSFKISNFKTKGKILYQEDPILIEMVYENITSEMDEINVVFFISDIFDTVLFSINTMNSKNKDMNHRKKKLTWIIPKNIFSARVYFFNLDIFVNNKTKCILFKYDKMDIKGKQDIIGGVPYYIPLKIASEFELNNI